MTLVNANDTTAPLPSRKQLRSELAPLVKRSTPLAIGLLLVDLALVIDLRGTNLPLAPIVITAVLAWYGWQFRRRARQPHRPPVAAAA